MIAVLAYLCFVVLLLAAVVARLGWAWRQEQDRVASGIRFPRDVTAEQTRAFLTAISGGVDSVVTFEVARTGDGIVHRLITTKAAAPFVADQLRAAIPGARLVPDETSPACTSAQELRITDSSTPLRTDDPAGTSRALLAAVASSGGGEITVQWTITPRRRVPLLVPTRAGRSVEARLAGAIDDRIRGRRSVESPEMLRRLAAKTSSPLFDVALRVGGLPSSPDEPATPLLAPVLAALATARAPGVDIRPRSTRTAVARARLEGRRVPAFQWPLVLNAAELTALLGWPLDNPRSRPREWCMTTTTSTSCRCSSPPGRARVGRSRRR